MTEKKSDDKNRKAETLDLLLQMDGPKKRFAVALIHLIAAHKECFPDVDADWESVCRLLIPGIEESTHI